MESRRPLAAALLLALSRVAAFGEVVVFEETFGAVQGEACTPDFPAGWTRIDVDQREPHPNASFVDSAWVTHPDPFATDTNCSAVSTSWYSPAGASDDWLATPLIHVPEGAVLTWRSLNEDPSYPETYQVRYSFTTPTPAAFTANPVLFAGYEESGLWSEHRVDLDAQGLAGRAIHLAFRNVSNNQYFLDIDDVRVAFDDTLLRAEFGSAAGGVCSPSFPAGWIRHDVDGKTPIEGLEWIDQGWDAHDTAPDDLADCAAFSTSAYVEGGQADDWLITPALAIPPDSVLRWAASAFTTSVELADGYEVRWSAGGSDPADFLVAPERLLLSVPAESLEWTAREIDLDEAGLAGLTVRFAFRNHSVDKDVLAIDSIEVARSVVFRDGFDGGFAGAWSDTSGFP